MSFRKYLLLSLITLSLVVAGAAQKKQPPPPPAHAKSPEPAVTDAFIHKQFGDNCSLLPGPPQFVADIVNRTHEAQNLDEALLAAELVIKAQKNAKFVTIKE